MQIRPILQLGHIHTNAFFLQLISTNNDLKHFLSKTLCYVQQGSSNLYEQTGQVLDHLHKLELITGKRILDCDLVTYEITPLGRATYKGIVTY